MKKGFKFALMCLVVLTSVVSCSKDDDAAKIEAIAINIANTDAELVVGETMTLNFKVLPEDANDKLVTWLSSDESIATIENGVVTAVAKGEAQIKGSLANGISSTIKVTVSLPTYVISPDMVGTWKCIKLQARYTKEGTIYEEGHMDELFKIEGKTETEWCTEIKDAFSRTTRDNNEIDFPVALTGGEVKVITGMISEDGDVAGQLWANYDIDNCGIGFGDRGADNKKVSILWNAETKEAAYDQPGGSFYDFIYTCTIGEGASATNKTITIKSIRSFEQAK